MTLTETYWTLRDTALDYLASEVAMDYEKFERQDFISGEVRRQDPDQLIPGHLHEESLWNLSKKYRYEVLTPWETAEGKEVNIYTTIVSDERLTPNEVFEAAADHPSLYPPEEAAFRGEMEIEGVWYQ